MTTPELGAAVGVIGPPLPTAFKPLPPQNPFVQSILGANPQERRKQSACSRPSAGSIAPGGAWRGAGGYLEGLDERPQQRPDALPTAQQLDQAHDPEEAEEGDGDAGVLFRVLGPLTQQLTRRRAAGAGCARLSRRPRVGPAPGLCGARPCPGPEPLPQHPWS